MKQREILKGIYQMPELYHQIYEVMSVDAECEPEDYADFQIINEALFVRSKYTDLAQNWELAEELHGVYGKDAQTRAKQELNDLDKWLKKWLAKVPKKLINPRNEWYIGNTYPPLLKKSK